MIRINNYREDLMEKNDEDSQNLLFEYCEHLYETNEDYRDDFESAYDLLDSFLCVEFFGNATFNDLLKEFLLANGKTMEEAIRDYYSLEDGFLMVHGIGYSWASADLCGGTADGEAWREFQDFLRGRDMYLDN